MKRSTILFLVFSLVSASAQSIDLHQHLNKTRQLVADGNYKEALNRFEWFHNYALKHQPSMNGVRLSYAVADWTVLATQYPPAKEAMIKTRDVGAAIIKQGNNGKSNYNCDLFGDVVALNHALDENDETVRLFKVMDQEQSSFAKRCWIFAEKVIIEAQQYTLASKYVGDPMQQFIAAKGLIDYQKNHLVEETLKLIAVSLSVGDDDTAYEIRAAALAIVDDYRLHRAIAET
jgi:hypothetical protein